MSGVRERDRRSRSVRLRFAAFSSAGRRPDGAGKTNQDRFVVVPCLHKNHVHLFGVFDGHGSRGDHVSHYLRAHLAEAIKGELLALPSANMVNNPKHCTKVSEVHEQVPLIGQALKRAIARIQDDIRSKREINSSLSGSTAVIMLLIGRHMVTANVGDSRAVLFQLPKEAYDADARAEEAAAAAAAAGAAGRRWRGAPLLDAVPVTEDQTPDVPDERARIESSGGVVRQMRHRILGNPIGPMRVWSKEEPSKPGLAMSRSVGDDVATDIGVICAPVITYRYVSSRRDRWIVLASDGVWDRMQNEDVARVLSDDRVSDPAVAAINVVGAAVWKWMEFGAQFGSGVVDDTTALVLMLWPSSPATDKIDLSDMPSTSGDLLNVITSERSRPSADRSHIDPALDFLGISRGGAAGARPGPAPPLPVSAKGSSRGPVPRMEEAAAAVADQAMDEEEDEEDEEGDTAPGHGEGDAAAGVAGGPRSLAQAPAGGRVSPATASTIGTALDSIGMNAYTVDPAHLTSDPVARPTALPAVRREGAAGAIGAAAGAGAGAGSGASSSAGKGTEANPLKESVKSLLGDNHKRQGQ